MKKILAGLAMALVALGCPPKNPNPGQPTGGQCSTTVCTPVAASGSGPGDPVNKGASVTACADTINDDAIQAGSLTYGGTTCVWSGDDYASEEAACDSTVGDWCYASYAPYSSILPTNTQLLTCSVTSITIADGNNGCDWQWTSTAGSFGARDNRTGVAPFIAPSTPGPVTIKVSCGDPSPDEPTYEADFTVISGGDCTGGTPTSVAVNPSNTPLLSCTQTQFSATVAPKDASQTVAWSASVGTISATGLFTAPLAVGPLVITATTPDGSIGQISGDPIVTATPQPSTDTIATDSSYPDVFVHAMGSNGKVVYAALPSQDGGAAPGIKVWRSADGGQSFQPTTATMPSINAGTSVGAVSVAVDAGDASTVYIAFAFGPDSGLADTPDGGAIAGIGLLVSRDQGAMFTFYLLAAGGFVGFPDVVSPAAGAVVVSNVSDGNTPPDLNVNTGFTIFADTTYGAGFLGGATPTSSIRLSDASTTYIDAGNASGQDGNAWSGPHLFTDGHEGVCITYTAVLPTGAEPRVQCSSDLGRSFGPEIKPLAQPSTSEIVHPSGTLFHSSAATQLAVAWTDDDQLFVATVPLTSAYVPAGSFTTSSTTSPLSMSPGTIGAAPLPNLVPGEPETAGNADIRFDGTGALWLAFETVDSIGDRGIAVAKSCDGGKTWSNDTGGVFGNVTSSGTLDAAVLPGLVPLGCTPLTPGSLCEGMGLSASSVDYAPDVRERFYRLTP